jgi:hypothetical protein
MMQQKEALFWMKMEHMTRQEKISLIRGGEKEILF